MHQGEKRYRIIVGSQKNYTENIIKMKEIKRRLGAGKEKESKRKKGNRIKGK
jgi:hypothetical protein